MPNYCRQHTTDGYLQPTSEAMLRVTADDQIAYRCDERHVSARFLRRVVERMALPRIEIVDAPRPDTEDGERRAVGDALHGALCRIASALGLSGSVDLVTTVPEEVERRLARMAPLDFPAHKCGLYLEHNPHRDDCALSIEAYEQERPLVAESWVSPEERSKAIETDELWTLQWYPETPIGFVFLAAQSLEALLAAAKEGNDA